MSRLELKNQGFYSHFRSTDGSTLVPKKFQSYCKTALLEGSTRYHLYHPKYLIFRLKIFEKFVGSI